MHSRMLKSRVFWTMREYLIQLATTTRSLKSSPITAALITCATVARSLTSAVLSTVSKRQLMHNNIIQRRKIYSARTASSSTLAKERTIARFMANNKLTGSACIAATLLSSAVSAPTICATRATMSTIAPAILSWRTVVVSTAPLASLTHQLAPIQRKVGSHLAVEFAAQRKSLSIKMESSQTSITTVIRNPQKR